MAIPFIFMGVVVIVVIGAVIWMVISGRKKDEAWMQLASEIGAEFIKGGFMRASKVQAHIQEWTVTLDTYTVSSGDSSSVYTRIKAPFDNKDGLQFSLGRKGIISKLDKALGAKEIETGDAEFDRDFYIRSKDEAGIRALFANMRIRQLIEGQRSIHLGIRNNDLTFEAQGEIKDVERLKSLFDLFREMLTQLKG
jgi:hypothetical protein